uniref:HIN-200 domain-containing protein n=1 Tax=Peromyscus maniculatus bairdii TaxID=230844 RepID=A0A8C8TT24_PERMB
IETQVSQKKHQLLELSATNNSSATPNNGNLPKEPSKVEGHHRDPKQVMVLKVTEPFTYDLINNKRMFHATVATETEFFRVKVFDTALKNKFIPQKIIAISDYFGVSGFLEIYGVSCVSDVNVNQTMVISNTLRRRANGTPKIKDLFSQTKGTYVNGRFVVTKKNERGDFIYYGIEDDTGKMEVVVSGPLTCIKCEPDNKVQLICFQLTSRGDTWQLKSVSHSYMQKKRKQTTKTKGGKKMKLTQKQTQLLEPSGSNPQKDECCLQTPHKPPATPSSSSSNKVPLSYSQCLPFPKAYLWTPNNGNLPKEPSKVEGHHRDPIQVMVLKVTEPFTYDLIDGKRMFHATVATETEFFRVKVFDTALKNKFIPQKIIAISDYFGTSGFLEIYGASCVSDVNVNQTMVISNTLRRRANGTPKIKDLFSQTKGTYVNGEFVVTKKNERGDFIHYGIEDDTGKMEVVVYGRLTSINCEPGNKLRLVCFELTSREDTWQLKSVRHSYMQVLSTPEGEALNPDSVMKTSVELYF